MVTIRSLRALDWLNFFIANVQTGFGPFIASYLASEKWTQGEIGVALSVGTITAMVSQLPAGAVVDAIRSKHFAAISAIVAVTISALMFALSTAWISVVGAEVLHGFASCMLVPALAAISLKLVGRANLGDRLGRNARWASIGSAFAALLMGLFGQYVSVRAIFWLTAALTIPSIFALVMIEGGGDSFRWVDRLLARFKGRGTNNAAYGPGGAAASAARAAAARAAQAAVTTSTLEDEPKESIWILVRDRRLLTFAVCIVLFHLSNAAMLNLAAGEVTLKMGDHVQLVIAACIVVPQIIVAAMSPWVGRASQRWGRRPILVLGFSALPIRALLFAVTSNSPYLLVPVQAFDGLSAAVFGVMLPLIAADVAGGKGRYNLCIGFFGLAAGVGATLSTSLAGFAADRFGSTMAFFGLAAVGALAVLTVWLAMPETRERTLDNAAESLGGGIDASATMVEPASADEHAR
ncbi:ABC transporter permease [Robbsia andropogonis]|uniref:ABC transporter permease n=1 Tax=Robbsia andropogonis TaxID=28092 RepID=A0A0F5JY22_9BURK|nr:MFS transporter [Robbsia andropogonis]KKB62182.1 ABC transporter permease [Robbsia andropogonis]